nr:uncharacterized mitochondrial protein AtMg00810-like [Tanacetum cinerariifolium]
MRIEHNFLMTDYSLWEAILNGDSLASTRVIEGVVQPIAPTTAEQRLARKNELKARGLSSESLDQIHDRLQKLISQLEIFGESLSQEDINLKFLRSLPTEWRTHTLIWRNKTDLEEQSLDDLFNSLKIYEAELVLLLVFLLLVKKIHVSFLANVDTLVNAVIGQEGILEKMDLLLWALIYQRWSAITATEKGTLKESAAMTEVFTQNRNLPIMPSWHSPLQVLPVLTMRPFIKNVETSILAANPKIAILKPKSHANSRNRKAFFGNLQHALKDRGVIDSGFSRHMTENMSYLSNFEEIKGGYVAFGGNPKGGRIFGKGKIRTGKLDFKDVYFVKELKLNLFIVSQMCDKKNSVLFTDTKCIVLSLEFKLPDENQVLNMVLVTKPHNKTPYELIHGKTPNIGFMRPFGCLVTILNTLDSLGKFDGKVDKGFLVGYSVSSTAFRVFNSRTQIVHETLHINFLENKPNVACSGPTWLFDIDTLTKTMNYQPVTKGNQSNPSTGNTDGDAAFKVKEPEFEGRKPESEVYVFSSSNAQTKKHDDKTNREAKGKSHVESSTGYLNLSAKFEDLFDNNINEVNAVDTSVPTVEKIDTNSTNTFSAAGPSNDANITYSDDEEDVGTEADFTNLETTITVSPILTTRVRKDHYINNNGFHTCMFACFLSQKEPKRVHQALKDPSWIEAMQEELFLQDAEDLCKAFEKLMKDKFQMSSMGELTFFLGLQVKQKPDGIFISQDKYVAEILRKFGLTDGKSTSTPINIDKPLLKDHDGEDVDVHTYISMIGSLMYLTLSRPDIMFAVCACARFQVTPKVSHLHVVKRIFRYLKGKPHLGLWYPKDSPFNLVAYSNSNYACTKPG